MGMKKVIIKNLSKWFGKVLAVNKINLDIEEQEFIVLVGPSGCGKTTTLRMIAGIEDIDNGEIYINKQLVNDVPAKNRNIAMVFQNYALYPHMSIYQNLAFGLKMRKIPKKEIEFLVLEVAKTLDIDNLLNRKPKQLSGGQKQRVAVGRALVRKPEVFLFDEPLSNLDAKLRVQMRTELKKLQKRLKATVIYVTHDQVEAMTMGDRIVIMKDGKINQVGSPLEVYNNPANAFVAGFIGSPAMNFMPCRVQGDSSRLVNDTGGLQILLNGTISNIIEGSGECEFTLGIRPEDIVVRKLNEISESDSTIRARINVVELLGRETFLDLTVGSQSLTAIVPPDTAVKANEEIGIEIIPDKIHLFNPISGVSIL